MGNLVGAVAFEFQSARYPGYEFHSRSNNCVEATDRWLEPRVAWLFRVDLGKQQERARLVRLVQSIRARCEGGDAHRSSLTFGYHIWEWPILDVDCREAVQ